MAHGSRKWYSRNKWQSCNSILKRELCQKASGKVRHILSPLVSSSWVMISQLYYNIKIFAQDGYVIELNWRKGQKGFILQFNPLTQHGGRAWRYGPWAGDSRDSLKLKPPDLLSECRPGVRCPWDSTYTAHYQRVRMSKISENKGAIYSEWTCVTLVVVISCRCDLYINWQGFYVLNFTIYWVGTALPVIY